MSNQKKYRCPSFLVETLENRQFLTATTTALTIADRSTTLGQTITVKAVVTSTAGTPHGTVELLDENKDTGLIGTLNHLGYYVFTLNGSDAAYTGAHEYRIRYLTDGSFVGSISRDLSAKVAAPKYTAETGGLELATAVTGSGAEAKSGETVSVEYTGFDAANGTVFDDSEKDGQDFSFELGTGSVITGFEDEVDGMKVGETRDAVIPSALGYSDGETRIFVVTLLSIS
jgi:hypothetical protein